jgi:hypothetical protein
MTMTLGDKFMATFNRFASLFRRGHEVADPPPACVRRDQDDLSQVVTHLAYLGYEVGLPEPDGWSYAQHPLRYDFHLRTFPWGIRLHCAVPIDAAAGNSLDTWLAYLNTANEKSRFTQFSLFEDRHGMHGVRMRAFASGAYGRQAFAMVMDMWHDDLDWIRRKPVFPASDDRGEGAVGVMAVTVN